MFDPTGINSAAGAFAAGLVTSLHCVGMCAPLACMVSSMRRTDSERMNAAVLYHGGRIASYIAIGAIAGSLGAVPISALNSTPVMLLPWLLAVAMLVIGFGLDRRLPKPRFLCKLLLRSQAKLSGMSAAGSGFSAGLLTPLLPCGPLYLMFGIALLSGSTVSGAEFMAAFALGTLPALWIAQHQLHRLNNRMKPRNIGRLRSALALLAGGVMLWRLWGAPPVEAPTTVQEAAEVCPLCQ